MQQVLNLSGLLLGNAFAEDNGCKCAVVGDHLARQLLDDRGFLAVGAQLALAQGEILALLDLLASSIASASSLSCSASGSTASMAEIPCGMVLVGTTITFFSSER